MTNASHTSDSDGQAPKLGDLLAWKAAQAAERKRQRQQRWKRKPPPVTGVRAAIPRRTDSEAR